MDVAKLLRMVLERTDRNRWIGDGTGQIGRDIVTERGGGHAIKVKVMCEHNQLNVEVVQLK